MYVQQRSNPKKGDGHIFPFSFLRVEKVRCDDPFFLPVYVYTTVVFQFDPVCSIPAGMHSSVKVCILQASS